MLQKNRMQSDIKGEKKQTDYDFKNILRKASIIWKT